MKTKTFKIVSSCMFLFCFFLFGLLFTSCGGDDEEDDIILVKTEPSLDLTVAGVSYTGDFSGNNAAIIATTNPQLSWTSVTLGGSTTTGETISFVLAFQGKQPGSSTVVGAAGEDTNAPEGLSVGLVVNNGGQVEAVSYEAVSVTINITSYRGISGITAEVEGTFSGTVEDDDGNQSSISGSFSTGTIN